MAVEPVLVTEAFVDPLGRVALLAMPAPIRLQPGVDDRLDRIDLGLGTRLAQAVARRDGVCDGFGHRVAGVTQLAGNIPLALSVHQMLTSNQFVIVHLQHLLASLLWKRTRVSSQARLGCGGSKFDARKPIQQVQPAHYSMRVST